MSVSGYIIEKYNHMTNAYTCNRLVEEAGHMGIRLDIVGVHDTYLTKDGVWNDGQILQQRDFVINRYKVGKVKENMNSLARRSYNKLDMYDKYINKYEQVRNLHSEAFLMPEYMLSTVQMPYQAVVDCLGSPFIAKGLESSMGREVFLIRDEKEYESLKVKFGTEKEVLFEEFITTSLGRDIRFYSIRGKAEACMVRKSQRDFRANVALGASVEPYAVTDEIVQIAEDIYSQTNLEFLGIDLLFGENKPYFCEINVMPGIEGIEKASGRNIARRIMETIGRDFE